MLLEHLLDGWQRILLWGFVATVVLNTVLHGSQGIGMTRLSLPFLVGTLFTGKRALAGWLGFLIYLVGGWVFALIYFLIFIDLGIASPWFGTAFGAAIGAVHGLFLLVVVLPLLPFVHPRMATEYDGPTATRRIEPAGFLGLNYGWRTPFTTLLGHTLFGAVLGAAYPFAA